MRDLVLAVVLAHVAAAASGQGLGAAAAKEKQRRAAQPSQPAKVITEADLESAAAGRDVWTSPDGGFRVAFSGQPEVKDDPGGGVTYRVRAGTTALLVNVRPASGSDLEAVANEARGAALGSLGGASLVSERPVTTGRGVAGREFVISFTGRNSGQPGVISNRVFLSGGQQYVVTAVADGGDASGAGSAFLDSFEALK